MPSNRAQRRKVLPFTTTVSLADLRPSPVRRAPDPAWLPHLEVIREAFAEVYPKSLEEWAEGFCRDLHPEREIAIWLSMATRYRRALARRKFTLAERREIGWMILMWSMTQPPSRILADVQHLSADEADAILREIGREVGS